MGISSIFSWELLFWLPSVTDLLLLVITYGSCKRCGKAWWFKHSPDFKKDALVFNSVDKTINIYHEAREKVLWDLALIAYSAYGVLFLLAFYKSVIDVAQRTAFSWALSIMMIIKLGHTDDKAARDGILFWSLPMYGTYAILKSFVLK